MRAVVAAILVAAAVAAAASPAKAATWCGTEASGSDRLPEAVSAAQIHVVYAFPSGGADRFGALAPAIVGDLEAIDAWWRAQDGSRTPRFDLYDFPNCPGGLSRLDLTRVQLPHDASYYAPLGPRLPRMVNDLVAPPSSLEHPYKKYLVYYDGPVEEPSVCGESPVLPTSGGTGAFSLVFLGARCPQDLGAGSFQAAVVAHELTHNLGALVFPGPLHPCPRDHGHPCDFANDLMYPLLTVGLPELVLDAGHDDYYGHSGGWWDVQDSEWLSHVSALKVGLAVSLEGSSGTGRVSSERPGIDCPEACSIGWDQGATVTLVAQPNARARFAGWSGACRGTGNCEVAMDAAKTVRARFALQVGLKVRVTRRAGAGGSVSSAPARIACPTVCTAEFDKGSRVTLRAKPRRGSRFLGWGGTCRGTGACTLGLNSARTVQAAFGLARR